MRAHLLEFKEVPESPLEHPRDTVCLCHRHTECRLQIGRESREDIRAHGTGLQRSLCSHMEDVPLPLPCCTKLCHRFQECMELMRDCSPNLQIPSCEHSRKNEESGFEVIRRHRVRSTMQRSTTDREVMRPDAGNFRTHGLQ